MTKPLFCILGASASGKSTLVQMLEKEFNMKQIPSCTTRLPRYEGETGHTFVSEKEFKALLNRLSRIEGQVRGVRSMLENDAYCIDILTQVSAINAALNSFNKVLIANHIRTCVKENIQAGNDEVVEELVSTLQKLMK